MMAEIQISEKMSSVNDFLVRGFRGPAACISSYGENIIVEVPRKAIDEVVSLLKEGFRDVADIRKAYPMIDCLHDFILVKPLVSEAPVEMSEGLCLASPEKRLVDIASDKEYSFLTDAEVQVEYQKAFESYDISLPKILRYASRKGEREQVQRRIDALDRSRLLVIDKIRSVLRSSPVTEAWVFGSFSRMEEKPESDIDLLFKYDKSLKFSLLDHIGLKQALELSVGREIDLVADGTLLPFALDSVGRDKYKIYERKV